MHRPIQVWYEKTTQCHGDKVYCLIRSFLTSFTTGQSIKLSIELIIYIYKGKLGFWCCKTVSGLSTLHQWSIWQQGRASVNWESVAGKVSQVDIDSYILRDMWQVHGVVIGGSKFGWCNHTVCCAWWSCVSTRTGAAVGFGSIVEATPLGIGKACNIVAQYMDIINFIMHIHQGKK